MKMTTSTQRRMTPTAMPTISPREGGEGVVAKRKEGGRGRGSVKGREGRRVRKDEVGNGEGREACRIYQNNIGNHG